MLAPRELDRAPATAGSAGASEDGVERTSDASRCVDAWKALERLPGRFCVDVHPSDDMHEVIATSADFRRAAAQLAYLRSGQEVLVACEHALASIGRSFASAGAVLDFASGYGRVTRFLQTRVPRERLRASDILPGAVRHLDAALGAQAFPSATEPAGLAWPRRFDIVLVASLFSHLPRHRFVEWLAKLRTGLAEDGVLLFTTHGAALPIAPASAAGGFAFVPRSESRTLAEDEYGSAFVDPRVVAQLAIDAGFGDVRWLEREIWMLQDLFVASVRPNRSAGEWRHASVLTGAIDGIDAIERSGAWLHGWAACRNLADPIVRASRHLDQRKIAEAVLHPPRIEEASRPRPSRQVKSEWHLEATIPAELDGEHTVALVVETVSRATACVDVRCVEVRDGRAGVR